MLLSLAIAKSSSLLSTIFTKAIGFDSLFLISKNKMTADQEKLFTPSFMFAFTANLLLMMAFYTLMPTLPFYLIETLHLEKSMVGVLVSTYIISAVVIRPFSSLFIDTLDRKAFFIAVFICFALLFGGYILFASFALLLVIRILHGFVWGIIIPLSNTLAIDVMPASRRGSGIGYFGMSSNLAMALGPVVGLVILNSFGFSSLVVMAIAISIAGIVVSFLIKVPHKPHIKHDIPLSLDRFILVKGIPLGVNIMIACFSYGLVVAYGALYGHEMGVSNTGMFFILLAAGILVARIVSSKFIDKGRFDGISILSLLMLTFGFFFLGWIQNGWIYYSMALFVGVACGMLFPTIQTMTVNLATHNQRGTANSTYFTAFDIGVGSGMLFGGIIAEAVGLKYAFYLSAALNLVATIYYIYISSPYYRKAMV